MKNFKNIVLPLLVLIALITAGCQSAGPTEQEIRETEAGYPAPETVPDMAGSYPADGYPAEPDIPIEVPGYNRGPDFNILEPVVGGDMVVEGNGPTGVPINLIDFSTGGTLLGTTIIETDGTFKFELEQPLVSGNSIAIQLGDISGTDLNPDDFIYNENYYDRPYVGILFDMVIVE